MASLEELEQNLVCEAELVIAFDKAEKACVEAEKVYWDACEKHTEVHTDYTMAWCKADKEVSDGTS